MKLDVVVLGAGSAGAAAAGMLARDGRRVALVEARSWEASGAKWVDDVPPWMFDRAGIARPSGPEKRCDHIPITLLGASGRARIEVGLRPQWGVDMRKLTARLRDEALAAGVQPFERATLERVVTEGGRPVEISLATADPARRSRTVLLTAGLFVDATGLQQALLRRVPQLAAACPPPTPLETCSAAQEVREVIDRRGAEAFLDAHGVGPGHVLSFMGVHGGFSSFMVQVEPGLERVEVLAGVADDGAHGTGSELLHAKLARHSWIGPLVFGGGGRIPIRRPYDRLAAPGIALLADAGCQTFPAHASGVGSGLAAARILADAVRRFDDPGSTEATWAYQAGFQRERGGVHAAYDLMRRATQRLDGAALEKLMAGGLISAETSRAALDQVMPAPGPGELARMAFGVARAPAASAGIAASALRMHAVRRLYGAYPQQPDEGALRRWSRAAALLCR